MPLFSDMHSHILPNLDDGVRTAEEAKRIVDQMHQLGYSKLIITPHIISGRYGNTRTSIKAELKRLRELLKDSSIVVEVAAEYYLDQALIRKLYLNEPLITFGDNYLLVETDFLTPPYSLDQFMEDSIKRGYKPVLAHPERYQYLINDFERVEKLRNMGVLFQVNIPSLIGFYSKCTQRVAAQLIEKGWVDFLGSDCHGTRHISALNEAFKSRLFNKALALPLLNRTL